MINLLIVCVAIFGVLIFSEFLHHKKLASTELSRKLVHVLSGIIVAFMPFFASWLEIQILGIAFVLVILISKKVGIFRSIHAVERVTIGEILFALAIVLLALLEPKVWIFTISILHLAVADSAAALVGVKWGKLTSYSILGNKKSLHGNLAFFVTSVLIMLSAYVTHRNEYSFWYLVILVPIVLTIIESLSWYGIDNFLIPIACLYLLTI